MRDECLKCRLQVSRARKIGINSLILICLGLQWASHMSWNQHGPETAAHPQADASGKSCILNASRGANGVKIEMPLKSLRKDFQTWQSDHIEAGIRRKGRQGPITLHAKDKWPDNDWHNSKCAVHFPVKDSTNSNKRNNLSSGNLACMSIVSTRMPWIGTHVEREMVLEALIGIPT